LFSGTGNSKFYTQTDLESHNRINRIPSVRRLNELDQTLYLSKSTFYNDQKFDNRPNENPSNFDRVDSGKSSRSAGTNPIKATKDRIDIIANANKIQDSGLSDYRAKNITDPYPSSNQAVHPSNVAVAYSPGNQLYSQRNGMCVSLPPQSPPPNLPKKVAPLRSHQPIATQSSLPSYTHPPLQPLSNYSLPAVPASAAYRIKQHSSERIIPVQHFYTNTYHEQSDINKCRTHGCTFFGSASSNYYCSKCCQEYQQQQRRPKILTDV
jgi:OTU domain-containing protein 7